jgi:hypothetical protein
MKFVYKNIKYFIKQSVTDLRHMTSIFVHSRTIGTSLRRPLTEQPHYTHGVSSMLNQLRTAFVPMWHQQITAQTYEGCNNQTKELYEAP